MRIAAIFLGLLISGCQQKSEIDKCVDALVKAICFTDKKCAEQQLLLLEDVHRLKCLKAQAGKD